MLNVRDRTRTSFWRISLPDAILVYQLLQTSVISLSQCLMQSLLYPLRSPSIYYSSSAKLISYCMSISAADNSCSDLSGMPLVSQESRLSRDLAAALQFLAISQHEYDLLMSAGKRRKDEKRENKMHLYIKLRLATQIPDGIFHANITAYSELEKTHKDHRVQLPASHRAPKMRTTLLRVLVQKFLSIHAAKQHLNCFQARLWWVACYGQTIMWIKLVSGTVARTAIIKLVLLSSLKKVFLFAWFHLCYPNKSHILFSKFVGGGARASFWI